MTIWGIRLSEEICRPYRIKHITSALKTRVVLTSFRLGTSRPPEACAFAYNIAVYIPP